MIEPAVYAELQKLCLRSFPGRLDQRVSQVRWEEDARHRVLVLTLSWRQGRQPRVERLVLRRYLGSWTWWARDDARQAHREWAVMRWLYAEGLPVPEVYAVVSHQGKEALLAACASGERAASSWPSDQRGEGSAQDAERCVRELAGLLAQLHRLTPPTSVRDVLPRAEVPEERSRLGRIARDCGDDGLRQALNELNQKVEARPPCVLHGDPQFAHVLCDARGITALLDWENSALGDPRWDVARVVNWLHLNGPRRLGDRFCALYQEREDVQLTQMSYWEALVAVQQWAMARCSLDSGGPAPSLAELEQWREQAWRALARWRAQQDD